MLFPFDYPPKIAIIGDIVGSKNLYERKNVQKRLNLALDDINIKYEKDISSKFIITLGDEFQGLLQTGTNVLNIIEIIEWEMYPVKIRFGIGVGKITTEINTNLSLGADGPAYYHARKMIDELKSMEKKNMEAKPNIKILIEDHPEISDLINAVFSLNTALKEKWTERQREIIHVYLKSDRTQSEVAKELDINQSSVNKALSKADFYTFQKSLETVANILSDIR